MRRRGPREKASRRLRRPRDAERRDRREPAARGQLGPEADVLDDVAVAPEDLVVHRRAVGEAAVGIQGVDGEAARAAVDDVARGVQRNAREVHPGQPRVVVDVRRVDGVVVVAPVPVARLRPARSNTHERSGRDRAVRPLVVFDVGARASVVGVARDFVGDVHDSEGHVHELLRRDELDRAPAGDKVGGGVQVRAAPTIQSEGLLVPRARRLARFWRLDDVARERLAGGPMHR